MTSADRTITSERPDRAASVAHPLLVTLGLAAGPIVALGLARFAYALVLPTMRNDLHWSFATAGALNTANALGYLVGALAAAPIAVKIGERTAYIGGLVVTGLAVLTSSLSPDVPVLAVLRLLAGAAGAVCFVVGGSLAARAGIGRSGNTPTLLLGVYFAGGGIGIVASGLVVPAALSKASWQGAWIVLGVLALVTLVGAVPAARTIPLAPRSGSERRRLRWPARRLAALLAAYGVFGAGYIAYMTFIVAYLQHAGASSLQLTAFWVVLGVAAIGGGFVWGPVLNRFRGGRSTTVVLLGVTVGAVLPLLSANLVVSLGSAVLFGATFLTAITSVTSIARRSLPQHYWTAAIASLTTVFALGQCLGPVLAGVLSDGPGGVRTGLTIGVVLLVVAAMGALLQPEVDRDSVAEAEMATRGAVGGT